MRISDWNSDVCSSDLNTHDTLETTVASYRGEPGFNTRAIGALAVDVKWPLIGSFLGGTQRLTPRVQVVASPHIANRSEEHTSELQSLMRISYDVFCL